LILSRSAICLCDTQRGEIRHPGTQVKVRNSGFDRDSVRNSAGLEELSDSI
jgi:hypothetical protein